MQIYGNNLKDYNRVRAIQKNLINYYQQDFSKHAEIKLAPRLNLVWNSIPMQLAKENKKYIYGQVRKGSRAKDFELAIQWLLDCGLIHKVQRIQKPDLPLKAYIDFDAFKLFLVDIGLLIAMTDLDAKVIIEGNKIFTELPANVEEINDDGKELPPFGMVLSVILIPLVLILLSTLSKYMPLPTGV